MSSSLETEDEVDETNKTEFMFVHQVLDLSALTCSPEYHLSNPCRMLKLDWSIGIEKSAPSLDTSKDFLHVFLRCEDPSKSALWSCFVKFRLTILSQKVGVADYSKGKRIHLFCSTNCSRGHSKFMTLDEINDPKNGFVKNDVIKIQAHIVADHPTNIDVNRRIENPETASGLLSVFEKGINKKIVDRISDELNFMRIILESDFNVQVNSVKNKMDDHYAQNDSAMDVRNDKMISIIAEKFDELNKKTESGDFFKELKAEVLNKIDSDMTELNAKIDLLMVKEKCSFNENSSEMLLMRKTLSAINEFLAKMKESRFTDENFSVLDKLRIKLLPVQKNDSADEFIAMMDKLYTKVLLLERKISAKHNLRNSSPLNKENDSADELLSKMLPIQEKLDQLILSSDAHKENGEDPEVENEETVVEESRELRLPMILKELKNLQCEMKESLIQQNERASHKSNTNTYEDSCSYRSSKSKSQNSFWQSGECMGRRLGDFGSLHSKERDDGNESDSSFSIPVLSSLDDSSKLNPNLPKEDGILGKNVEMTKSTGKKFYYFIGTCEDGEKKIYEVKSFEELLILQKKFKKFKVLQQ